MKKITTILTLLISTVANAQFRLLPSHTVVGDKLPLNIDGLSTLAKAGFYGGFSRLDTGYHGYAVELYSVHRDEHVEIGFTTGTNLLDTFSIDTMGCNYNDSCFVTIFYNQGPCGSYLHSQGDTVALRFLPHATPNGSGTAMGDTDGSGSARGNYDYYGTDTLVNNKRFTFEIYGAPHSNPNLFNYRSPIFWLTYPYDTVAQYPMISFFSDAKPAYFLGRTGDGTNQIVIANNVLINSDEFTPFSVSANDSEGYSYTRKIQCGRGSTTGINQLTTSQFVLNGGGLTTYYLTELLYYPIALTENQIEALQQNQINRYEK